MATKKTTKKATSTGSPTLDAANAAKNFKAPKDYKPMTTAQKVALAASLVGPDKFVKGAKTVKGLVTGAEKTVSQVKRARMLTGHPAKKDSVYALSKGAGAKAPVKAVAKKNTAKEADRIAKNSVKVIKSKTAPKGAGLETRGKRFTELERRERDWNYLKEKIMKEVDDNNSNPWSSSGKVGRKHLTRNRTIYKAGSKPDIIKINSKKSK